MEYNWTTTATNGNNKIKEIFTSSMTNSKYQWTVDLPESKYSRYDAIVYCNKKKYLVEHKNRNFDKMYLHFFYNDELVLELHKYEALNKINETGEFDDILYVNTLTCGTTYIHKFSDMKKRVDNIYASNVSCGEGYKKNKDVYKLNISSALILN